MGKKLILSEIQLKKLIVKIINEINDPQEIPKFPKNKWILMKPGDPRRELVKNNIFDMVQQTYAPIGGHFKIQSPDDLEKSSYWLAEDLDEDPHLDVVMLAKPESGAKMATAANDGSSAASSAFKDECAELFSGGSVDGIGNWWGETSDKVAYAMLNRGSPAVEDEMTVRSIMPGDKIIWHGEHPDPNVPEVFKKAKGWYTKFFNGHPSTKIILGNPS